MADTSSQATAPRLFALLVGGALVLAGIGGFLFESSFGTGEELASDDIAGTFSVNGWRNLLYMLVGTAGLALASRAPRPYALAVGGLFAVIAVWGWFAVDHGFGTLADVIPVSGTDNWLHLLIAAAGLAAGFADRRPRAEPA